MPLPEKGQQSWADELNDYLVGAALEAGEQLDEATQAARDAIADFIAVNGTQGLALDTDGQPYFDPALVGTAPTLALLVDDDGVPYIAGA